MDSLVVFFQSSAIPLPEKSIPVPKSFATVPNDTSRPCAKSSIVPTAVSATFSSALLANGFFSADEAVLLAKEPVAAPTPPDTAPPIVPHKNPSAAPLINPSPLAALEIPPRTAPVPPPIKAPLNAPPAITAAAPPVRTVAAARPPRITPPATTFFTALQSTFPKREEIRLLVVHISL